MLVLGFSGVVGSEFLPHLDEGAIWVRGTLAPSTGPTPASRLPSRFARFWPIFPRSHRWSARSGGPTMAATPAASTTPNFLSICFRAPKWRSQFKTKDDLIAAMDKELSKFPGVDWNFSQPISDNVEEAVSGVKGELAVKLFGSDLKVLEAKSQRDSGRDEQDSRSRRSRNIPGARPAQRQSGRGSRRCRSLRNQCQRCAGCGRNRGRRQGSQPDSDRRTTLRSDRPLPGAVSQDSVDDIANIRILAPSGERVSLGQLCQIKLEDGASTIYREGNSRYIAIKYSVRGRDLGSTVRQAIEEVHQKVQLPEGYHLDWTGEYESQQRANRRLAVIVPITLLLMSFILYSAFDSWKWVALILAVVALSPLGGLFSLLLTAYAFFGFVRPGIPGSDRRVASRSA